jgi:hypothetical protein
MAVVTMTRPITTSFVPGRSVEEQIAERMLAAALHNYRSFQTGKGSLNTMKSWMDLSDSQREFYTKFAIPRAMKAIWEGN